MTTKNTLDSSQYKLLPAITKSINASLYLSGSKSITNRVLLLAALSDGVSVLHNVADSADDVHLMIEALSLLGIKISLQATKAHRKIKNSVNDSFNEYDFTGNSYKIFGCNGIFKTRKAKIFCGASGTVARFITSVLSINSLFYQNASYTIHGIKRLEERPIADLLGLLNTYCQNMHFISNINHLPLTIKSPTISDSLIKGILDEEFIIIDASLSSQFASGFLIAFANLLHNITIYDEMIINRIPIIIIKNPISMPYVHMTISLLNMFYKTNTVYMTKVNEEYHLQFHNFMYTNNTIKQSSLVLKAVDYEIEADASSASYFFALALFNKGRVRIKNLNINSIQGDIKVIEIFKLLGYNYAIENDCITMHGILKTQYLNGINVNMNDMPDVAMTIAVLALFGKQVSTISGISSWVHKESNRLEAIQTELSKLGAIIRVTDDTIIITPTRNIKNGIIINTYKDHRIAMCFSLVSLFGVDVIINDYNVVNKTFKDYFILYELLCTQ